MIIFAAEFILQRRIRTRFVQPNRPFTHGRVRTALYAYCLLKNAGDFLLRIEDNTDRTALFPEEQYIIDALHWCGITIDEGVSVQEHIRHTDRKRTKRNSIEAMPCNSLSPVMPIMHLDTMPSIRT